MDVHIDGRIIAVLPEVGGTSKAGNAWRKQEYILETNDSYPKKICFNAFNDTIEKLSIQEGETLTVYVDIESREFNGRWYTDIRAWRVDRAEAPQAMGPMGIQGGAPGFAEAPQVDSAFNTPSEGDDLPF